MAGIYTHIPFCFSRCGYCDFYKTTRLDRIGPFVSVLMKEIEHYSSDLNERIETVYFGGGTPSLISVKDYRDIFKQLRDNYDIADSAEITMEANPDDINEDYLDAMLQIGFNRISIGIQSFHDRDLKEMGRRHNSVQALQAVNIANKAGFDNISIDLIYGLSWSDTASFKENLSILRGMSVKHISAYHLTFEEGTPFWKLLKRGIYKEIKDSESTEQYQELCRFLADEGFEHYEVSNFCKPSFHSRHNSSYWNHTPYIGFGPGSHSFYDGIRRWNRPDLSQYLSADWDSTVESEILDKRDLVNEIIMLGLRTANGFDSERIRAIDASFYEQVFSNSRKWLKAGHLILDDRFVKCPEDSWFIVDGIIKDIFI